MLVFTGVDGAWIGLSSEDASAGLVFEYTDSTSFNFNDDTSGGVGYWKSSEPSNNCARITQSGKWDTLGCGRWSRPLCNDCSGVINKYGFTSGILDIEYAKNGCNDRFKDTSLASIHSLRDNEEVVQIHAISYNMTQRHLWLGLSFTNKDDKKYSKGPLSKYKIS